MGDMAPYKIRLETVRQLRNTVVAMMSPDWSIALDGAGEEEVHRASLDLLAAQRARLKLGNALLEDIRDDLIENEDALLEGIEDAKQALRNLNLVRKTLDSVEKFLGVVGKVIP